jgi:hypothetical protein
MFVEGSGPTPSMQYPGIFLERPRKTTEDLRLTGVVSEFRTKHFANASLKRYCYTNLVGDSLLQTVPPVTLLLSGFHGNASLIVWF